MKKVLFTILRNFPISILLAIEESVPSGVGFTSYVSSSLVSCLFGNVTRSERKIWEASFGVSRFFNLSRYKKGVCASRTTRLIQTEQEDRLAKTLLLAATQEKIDRIERNSQHTPPSNEKLNLFFPIPL